MIFVVHVAEKACIPESSGEILFVSKKKAYQAVCALPDLFDSIVAEINFLQMSESLESFNNLEHFSNRFMPKKNHNLETIALNGDPPEICECFQSLQLGNPIFAQPKTFKVCKPLLPSPAIMVQGMKT